MILLENPPKRGRKRRATRAQMRALRKAWAARRKGGSRKRRTRSRRRHHWKALYKACAGRKSGGRGRKRRGRRSSWIREKLAKVAGKWKYHFVRRPKGAKKVKAAKAGPSRFIAPAPEGWVPGSNPSRRRRRRNRGHRAGGRSRRKNYTSWVPEFVSNPNPYWVPAYAMNPEVGITSLTDPKVWSAVFPAALGAFGNKVGTTVLAGIASKFGADFLVNGPGRYITGIISALSITTTAWYVKRDWVVPVLFGSLFQVGLDVMGSVIGKTFGISGLGRHDPYFNLWEQSGKLGRFNLWEQSRGLGSPEGAMLMPDAGLMEMEIESGTGMDAVIDDLEANEFTPDQSDLSWKQDVGLGAYLSRADYARAHALNYPGQGSHALIDNVAGIELATS